MKTILVSTVAVLLLFAAAAPLPAEDADPFIQVIPRAEIGDVAVLKHLYQSGTGGDLFNFVTQGGQDNLFPYQRYAVDVVLGGRHRVTLPLPAPHA